MELTDHQEGEVVTIAINGRLDANTSSTLEQRFAKLAQEGHKKFIFDLAAMDYISSAGLRSLLTAAKKMKAAMGRIALSGMNDNVREVFDMSGFSTIFTIYETQAKALAFLGE